MPVEVLNFHLKPWDFFTQVGLGSSTNNACKGSVTAGQGNNKLDTLQLVCTPRGRLCLCSCNLRAHAAALPSHSPPPMAQNPTIDLPPIPNKRTIDFDTGTRSGAGNGSGLAASCCAATARSCCGGGAGACTCQPGACACSKVQSGRAAEAGPSCCAKPAAAEPGPQPSSRL